MPVCCYVYFRKTTGAEPDVVQGQIVSNNFNATMAYDADEFAHPNDPDNYGPLEISTNDYNTMESNLQSGGTYGKHVDDPTGTPTLADGDPS